MTDKPHDIAVRPMTDKDLEAVLAIERDSFPHPWNSDHFHDELSSDHAFPLVALDREGRIIGYICPWFLFDEGHINNVAVHRACRGKGVGQMLVQRVLRDCRVRGGEAVYLEVRLSNAAAIALYRGVGFVETGRRRRYYANGEDAMLMKYTYAENGVDNAI